MTHTPFVSNPCPATAIVFVSQNLFYGQLPQAWCFVRGSVLPLAGLPIAVGEDHIVQIALDPLVGHCAITLLSSLFYDTVYPGGEKNTRTKFYIYTKN